METRCDTACQANQIFHLCLQEAEENVHAATILYTHVLACFNMVLDETFLALLWTWQIA